MSADLEKLRKEYRPSMGAEVLHSWAADVVAALSATAQPAPAVKAWQDVLTERQRQVNAEGWTPEHDDTHNKGEMARAAGIYALIAGANATDYRNARDGYSLNDYLQAIVDHYWPWAKSWLKVTTRRRSLVKAGALILGEIERLDRKGGSDV